MLMDLSPGDRLGPFSVNDSIVSVVAELRSNAEKWGSVRVKCDISSPIDRPFNLLLVQHRVRLEFSDFFLAAIVLEDPAGMPTKVAFRNASLCGPEAPTPTFVRMHQLFGPTFQGVLDARGMYSIEYPGLTIMIKIPAGFRHLYSSASAGRGDGEMQHRATLPDGTTPVVSKLIVRGSKQLPSPSAPLGAPIISARMKLRDGITFLGRNESVCLHFGDTPQNAMRTFGCPETVTYKTEDHLLLRGTGHTRCGYFFNYPAWGIDLMFDAQSNELVQIIGFTGLPPHEAFLRYHGLRFAVDVGEGRTVTSSMKWDEVQRVLGGQLPRPLLLSGSASWDGTAATEIFCLPGVIFCVSSMNGTIASIMIFRHETSHPAVDKGAGISSQALESRRLPSANSPPPAGDPQPTTTQPPEPSSVEGIEQQQPQPPLTADREEASQESETTGGPSAWGQHRVARTVDDSPPEDVGSSSGHAQQQQHGHNFPPSFHRRGGSRRR